MECKIKIDNIVQLVRKYNFVVDIAMKEFSLSSKCKNQILEKFKKQS